ncbi:MAG: tryptophan--tRNA ligase [Candidatus Theseobacter exili]|nr:tryptophan--tRNA ligase [Candidatus Theseobacter exili]
MTKKKSILTGDRPTGPLHLGHYVGSLENRVKLQHEYNTFVIIADVQALSTNFEHPENLWDDIRKVTLDYLSVGIDPEISTIFVQSLVPDIAELAQYFSMYISVNVLRHNPTIKTEASERGYKEMMYGFLGYPISQAADISIFKANLVPVGEDQVPHIELTRKIVRRFNQLYGETLVEPKALVSNCPRLVGLDGNTKMSKSLGNAIYLSDPDEIIAKKVRSAVTDPARIHPTDPGHPNICSVFAYQKTFNPEKTAEIESNCKAGKIGCVACKKMLSETLTIFLEPIRERRKEYEKNPKVIDEILMEGTKRARKVTNTTMSEVRQAMHIDYLNKARL